MAWADEMAVLLSSVMTEFGQSTTYYRIGYAPFQLTGVADRDPHLESQERGPFDAVSYSLADFNAVTPFHAFVDVTMKNIPGNDTYITVDGVTYTFKITLTQEAPNQVARGVNSAAAAQNLAAAINATAEDAGTRFSSATVSHPTCQATVDVSVVRILSIEPGTAGDNKIVSEDIYGTNLSTKLLAGGGPQIADLITLADGVVYRVGNDGVGYDGEGGVKLRLFQKTT